MHDPMMAYIPIYDSVPKNMHWDGDILAIGNCIITFYIVRIVISCYFFIKENQPASCATIGMKSLQFSDAADIRALFRKAYSPTSMFLKYYMHVSFIELDCILAHEQDGHFLFMEKWMMQHMRGDSGASVSCAFFPIFDATKAYLLPKTHMHMIRPSYITTGDIVQVEFYLKKYRGKNDKKDNYSVMAELISIIHMKECPNEAQIGELNLSTLFGPQMMKEF